jgi:hypothetical protein
MEAVALVSWIVTALAGATLFSIWLSRGGLRREGPGASRFHPDLIFGHPALAAAVQPSTELAPEQHFPVALIGLHGLLAITTLVLVLLTALGIGD